MSWKLGLARRCYQDCRRVLGITKFFCATVKNELAFSFICRNLETSYRPCDVVAVYERGSVLARGRPPLPVWARSVSATFRVRAPRVL